MEDAAAAEVEEEECICSFFVTQISSSQYILTMTYDYVCDTANQ